MRVRIKVHPRESELDGVRLDGFSVGSIRDVSPSIGSWLVAQGYADLEMRATPTDDERVAAALNQTNGTAEIRRRLGD